MPEDVAAGFMVTGNRSDGGDGGMREIVVLQQFYADVMCAIGGF